MKRAAKPAGLNTPQGLLDAVIVAFEANKIPYAIIEAYASRNLPAHWDAGNVVTFTLEGLAKPFALQLYINAREASGNIIGPYTAFHVRGIADPAVVVRNLASTLASERGIS